MKKLFNKFIVNVILFAIIANFASALEIQSPENIEYSNVEIPLEISSNTTFDNLSYKLNNNSLILLCENCTSYNDTIILEEGNHTLTIIGKVNNETITKNVSFSVKPIIPIDFNLEIISPLDITYNVTEINFIVNANETLDTINFSIDNQDFEVLCQNCSSHNSTLNLTQGNHSINVIGQLEETIKLATISFTIEVFENQTEEPDNEINETEDDDNDNEIERFSLGFNKLPKAVMNNEVDDNELADIIRSNALNPGIINRLIKTGKLGDGSIQAILDTQFNPPGILKKILAFIGFKQSSFAELIYENYELPFKSKHKLLMRDDIPKEYADNIKGDIRKKLKNKVIKSDIIEKLDIKEDKLPQNQNKIFDDSNDAKPNKLDKKTSETSNKITKKGKKVYNAGKLNAPGQNKNKGVKPSKGKNK